MDFKNKKDDLVVERLVSLCKSARKIEMKDKDFVGLELKKKLK